MKSKSYLKTVTIPDKTGIDVILTTDAETLRCIANLEGMLSMMKKLKEKDLLHHINAGDTELEEMEQLIEHISGNQEGPKLVDLLRQLELTI